jgi:uncharacterized protein (UPF0333 family)
VVVVVATISGAYFLGLFASSGPPWLFKGAYATYSGETTYLSYTFNMTVRVQILDFNSTYVKTFTYFSIQSQLGSQNNQTTSWNKRSSELNYTAPTGYTLSKTYDTTRLIAGNAVDCTAYEYTQGTTTMTAYISKSIGFPEEITFYETSSGTSISIDLTLVHTNIHGL